MPCIDLSLDDDEDNPQHVPSVKSEHPAAANAQTAFPTAAAPAPRPTGRHSPHQPPAAASIALAMPSPVCLLSDDSDAEPSAQKPRQAAAAAAAAAAVARATAAAAGPSMFQAATLGQATANIPGTAFTTTGWATAAAARGSGAALQPPAAASISARQGSGQAAGSSGPAGGRSTAAPTIPPHALPSTMTEGDLVARLRARCEKLTSRNKTSPPDGPVLPRPPSQPAAGGTHPTLPDWDPLISSQPAGRAGLAGEVPSAGPPLAQPAAAAGGWRDSGTAGRPFDASGQAPPPAGASNGCARDAGAFQDGAGGPSSGAGAASGSGAAAGRQPPVCDPFDGRPDSSQEDDALGDQAQPGSGSGSKRRRSSGSGPASGAEEQDGNGDEAAPKKRGVGGRRLTEEEKAERKRQKELDKQEKAAAKQRDKEEKLRQKELEKQRAKQQKTSETDAKRATTLEHQEKFIVCRVSSRLASIPLGWTCMKALTEYSKAKGKATLQHETAELPLRDYACLMWCRRYPASAGDALAAAQVGGDAPSARTVDGCVEYPVPYLVVHLSPADFVAKIQHDGLRGLAAEVRAAGLGWCTLSVLVVDLKAELMKMEKNLPTFNKNVVEEKIAQLHVVCPAVKLHLAIDEADAGQHVVSLTRSLASHLYRENETFLEVFGDKHVNGTAKRLQCAGHADTLQKAGRTAWAAYSSALQNVATGLAVARARPGLGMLMQEIQTTLRAGKDAKNLFSGLPVPSASHLTGPQTSAKLVQLLTCENPDAQFDAFKAPAKASSGGASTSGGGGKPAGGCGKKN